MKRVFADTFYWVASISANDQWHVPAIHAVESMAAMHLVTTEEVLVEFLSAYAGRGEYLRQVSLQTVRAIFANRNVTVLQQTHETFLLGLELYASRSDKSYSLVDCISMNTMRQLGIVEVLTNDHHFTQEGFVTLINP